MENKILKAVDFIPKDASEKRKGASEPLYEEMMLSDEVDGVVLALFGELPDYSDDRLEDLWQGVDAANPQDIYGYCRNKGIEVLADDGNPVAAWRDIAVMLKAIDAGIIEMG